MSCSARLEGMHFTVVTYVDRLPEDENHTIIDEIDEVAVYAGIAHPQDKLSQYRGLPLSRM